MGRSLLPLAAVALAVLAVVLLGTALRTDGPMPTPSVLPVAMDPDATQTPRIVRVDRIVTPTAPVAATETAMAATWQARARTPFPTRTPRASPTPPFGMARDTEAES